MKRKNPYKELWKKVDDSPDKVNKEGTPAYSGTPEMDVLNILMTGTTSNKFYADGVKITVDMITILKNFSDSEFLAKAIIYARKEGYMREMPIAGSVVLSIKDVQSWKSIAHDVMRNPRDWSKFIDISRSGVIRKGLGSGIKKQVKIAISNMSSYHAMKYPTNVKDMIRVSRPAEETNIPVIKYIMGGEYRDSTLKALESLKKEEDSAKVADIIRKAKLPYEVVSGSIICKMDANIWGALLDVAPYFNMIRNLNNFGKYGLFEDESILNNTVERITDEKLIQKSMMFPFRYFVAYEMIQEFPGHNIIRNALAKAIKISVNNVPNIDGTVAIAPDISGSMRSNLTGNLSVLNCSDLCGIFTGIAVNVCDNPILLPFNNTVNAPLGKQILEKEDIMSIAHEFPCSGGTSLASPLQYLLDNNIKVDKFIAFTDSEEWIGSRGWGGGEMFENVRKKYAEKYPDTQFYLVTLLPYRDYPTPEKKNVHYIFGWSDNVLKYITNDTDKQMEDVKNINILKYQKG